MGYGQKDGQRHKLDHPADDSQDDFQGRFNQGFQLVAIIAHGDTEGHSNHDGSKHIVGIAKWAEQAFGDIIEHLVEHADIGHVGFGHVWFWQFGELAWLKDIHDQKANENSD